MKHIQTWLLVAVTIALIISILTRPTKEITDIKPFQVQIAEQNLIIDSLSKSRTKLARKIAEDSILQAEERHTFQNAIGSLQTRLSKRRIRVDSILIDRPEAKEFISMQDSVISMQAGRIDTLENSLSDLRIDIKSLNRNFDLAMEAQVSRYNALEEINKLNEKALRKKAAGNKVWKALVPIGIIGGFLLGSQ